MAEAYHAFPGLVEDKLLGIMLALSAELWVVKDRLDLVERALKSKGIDIGALIDELARDSSHVPSMQQERDAFMERLFRPLTQA